MTDRSEHEDTVVRVVTIVVLGVVLIVSVIGLVLVAIFTERDLWRTEALVFAGALVVAAVGGLQWWRFRRRWHLRLDRNGEEKEHSDKP